MKSPVYCFGTAQSITPRAPILVSLAGPRGGRAAAFGMDTDQAEEFANKLLDPDYLEPCK